jgi:hypothetical protein
MKMRCVVAGLVLAVMAGCGTEHSIGVVLNPGETAHAKVLGDDARVEVATGPAPVHVTLKTAGMAAESVDVQGTIARTLKGDTEIDLANQGKEMAQVQVRTRNATGLSLERGK